MGLSPEELTLYYVKEFGIERIRILDFDILGSFCCTKQFKGKKILSTEFVKNASACGENLR